MLIVLTSPDIAVEAVESIGAVRIDRIFNQEPVISPVGLVMDCLVLDGFPIAHYLQVKY